MQWTAVISNIASKKVHYLYTKPQILLLAPPCLLLIKLEISVWFFNLFPYNTLAFPSLDKFPNPVSTPLPLSLTSVSTFLFSLSSPHQGLYTHLGHSNCLLTSFSASDIPSPPDLSRTFPVNESFHVIISSPCPNFFHGFPKHTHIYKLIIRA